MNVAAAVVHLPAWEVEEGESPFGLVVWDQDAGFPFDNYDEASVALDLTTQVLGQIMGDDSTDLVAEGWDDDMVFFVEALTDGMSEIRDMLPGLVELEEAGETLGGVFEGLLSSGLALKVQTPPEGESTNE